MSFGFPSDVLRALFGLVFRSQGLWSKLHIVALKYHFQSEDLTPKNAVHSNDSCEAAYSLLAGKIGFCRMKESVESSCWSQGE